MNCNGFLVRPYSAEDLVLTTVAIGDCHPRIAAGKVKVHCNTDSDRSDSYDNLVAITRYVQQDSLTGQNAKMALGAFYKFRMAGKMVYMVLDLVKADSVDRKQFYCYTLNERFFTGATGCIHSP